MSNSRQFSGFEIGKMAVTGAIGTAAGAGLSAAVRSGSVMESASIVGAGTGLFLAGHGFFAKRKKLDQTPTFIEAMSSLAFVELAGTAVGYVGAKLFIDAAVSTAPFVNATLGFPTTVGVMLCVAAVFNFCEEYYRENAPAMPTLRPRR